MNKESGYRVDMMITVNNGDEKDYTLNDADRKIHEFYRDHLHHNAGTHRKDGFGMT